MRMRSSRITSHATKLQSADHSRLLTKIKQNPVIENISHTQYASQCAVVVVVVCISVHDEI